MTTTEQYLHDRLIAIGLTDDTNTRQYFDGEKAEWKPIISVNEKRQAITIHYTTPSGEVSMFRYEDNELPFVRWRYLKEQVTVDKAGKEHRQRYGQPKDSGVKTYMTPGIVRKFRNAEKIKTLFVVEGEIKALAGDVFGMDIIAVGGIQNFRNKEANTIDPYITQIMEVCRPDNVVLLFDADCLSIKYEGEDKDLYTRLNNFKSAVLGFMEYMKGFTTDLYFCHIDEKFATEAKGLDDLLGKLKPKQKEEFRKELDTLSSGNKSFTKWIILSPGCRTKVTRYFRCDSVDNFYNEYKNILGETTFMWQKRTYSWNGTKLERDSYSDSRPFICVEGVYYRQCYKDNIDADGKELKPILYLRQYSKAEVKEEVRDLSMIPRFHLFTTHPDNTENYRRRIVNVTNGIETVCFNRYCPMEHNITPGEFPNIEKFLRHIFADKNTSGECLYEFGLDYIQHCYLRPTAKMPVLCFVSTERNTGKSSFLNFMCEIFGDNAVVLDNDRFTGRFTDHFADKLVVGLDEALVGEDKKTVKERIKNWATSPTLWCEPKGLKAYEIDNYIHLIIATNNETNFMQIDKGENRFAVIKVGTLTEDDPLLMVKMREEIGSFLHFLKNRKFHYPYHESRSGFATKVYETEHLKRVMERTENKINREIKQFIAECFISYNVNELYFAPKDLAQEMNREGGFSISKTSVMDFLKYDMNMTPCGLMRYDTYRMEFDPITKILTPVKSENKTGRPYKFKREDFIDDTEKTSRE